MIARATAVALTTIAALAGVGCAETPNAASAVPVTIVTGSTAGLYYPLGTAFARAIGERAPGVVATAAPSGASTENVLALESGHADVGFALGDVAYFAYAEGTRLKAAPHRKLRGMAVLYTNAVHFVVPAASPIRSIRDLGGKRLGWGAAMPTPGRSRSIDVLLQAHGVAPESVPARSGSFEDVLSSLQTGQLDVGVISAGFPVPTIEAAARVGLRFLDVDHAAFDLIQQDYPFFMPMSIPANTYSGQHADITTVGIDNVLLCREDLPEDLVYRLTKVFFDSLADLARAHPVASTIDADAAPATALPLHPGAARYYRERELLLY